MSKNIWKDFAELNNMSTDEFTNEIVTVAQAVLAMKLNSKGIDGVVITSSQDDGDYKLIFRRVLDKDSKQ